METDSYLSKLKTPEACLEFAEQCISLAEKARLKSIELRTAAHGNLDPVEKELWKVLYAYEDVLTKKNKRRTLASRTRQMISHYGMIEAAERAVNRKIEPMGYKSLVEMGYEELTFEAVIIRFPESFDLSVVNLARLRLDELKRSM